MKITKKELDAEFKPFSLEITFETQEDVDLWKRSLTFCIYSWDKIKVGEEYAYPINIITEKIKEALGE